MSDRRRSPSARVRRLAGPGALLPCALLTLTGACGVTGPEDAADEELDAAWERWERTRPASYRYGVELLCFCGDRGPVRVTVVGDDVTERTYVDSGAPVPAARADRFPSVDGLFAALRDAIERDAHRIEVTYDPVLGVPTRIFIDYVERIADEEMGFSVVEPVQAR